MENPSFYLEKRRKYYTMVTFSPTGKRGFSYVTDWYGAFALAYSLYPHSTWRQVIVGKRHYFFKGEKRIL